MLTVPTGDISLSSKLLALAPGLPQGSRKKASFLFRFLPPFIEPIWRLFIQSANIQWALGHSNEPAAGRAPATGYTHFHALHSREAALHRLLRWE